MEQFIPRHVDNHPKEGHRPRIDDRTCFDVMHVRLTTGCSWVDAERICGGKVSDTTVRERYSLWVDAGVFKKVAANAVVAYDRIIGLDMSEIAIDGSLFLLRAGSLIRPTTVVNRPRA
ncbi:transposase [Candidatus Microthrix parvicella]|nr:transposase [Candidatus Microthrix parvicella]